MHKDLHPNPSSAARPTNPLLRSWDLHTQDTNTDRQTSGSVHQLAANKRKVVLQNTWPEANDEGSLGGDGDEGGLGCCWYFFFDETNDDDDEY